MKHRLLTLPILLLILIGAATVAPPAKAQWNTAVQLISAYDNNSFAFYDRRADVYHQLFLAVSRDFETDYSFIQAYYYGAGVLFRTFDQRSYHQHTLGALWTIQLSHRENDESGEPEQSDESDTSDDSEDSEQSDDSEDSEQSDDSEDSEQSDDSDGGTEGNLEEGIAPADAEPEAATVTPAVAAAPVGMEAPVEAFTDSMVTYLHIKPAVSGRFDQAAYEMYDSRSATLAAQLRYRLLGPLMLRLHYGAEYKSYPNMPQFTNIENLGILTLSMRVHAGTELFTAVDFGYKYYTETVSDTIYNSVNSGKGKGGVKPKIKSIASFSTPSTDQFVISAGIVETIAAGHTASFSYLHRINPRNVARFLDKRTESDIQAYEADVFDDRYGYEADEYSLHLGSQVLTIPVTIQADFQNKRYPRTATSIAGMENADGKKRSDRRFEITAQCMIPLFRNADGSTVLSLGANYNYIRNQSNDAYHDYHIHQASLIVDWNL